MSKHSVVPRYCNLTKEEEDELVKERLLYREGEEDYLFDADEDCHHLTRGASGGGVECVKCGGWFCY